MNGLIKRLFRLDQYPTQSQRDSVQLLIGTLIVIVILYMLFSFFIPVAGTDRPAAAQLGVSPLITLTVLVFYPLAALSFVLIRAGQYNIARWMPALLVYVSVVLLGFNTGLRTSANGATLVAVIVLGVIFARSAGLTVTLTVALLTLVISQLNYRLTTTEAIPQAINEPISLGLTLIGVGLTLYFFLGIVREQTREAAGDVEKARQKLAETSTEITSRVLRRADLTDTLNTAVEEIRASYPLAYHVQIFLIDDARQNARLAASTGDVGQVLLARGHQLAVGSMSVIGRVTSRGEVVVARSGSTDSVHKRNEFLPETVVEAALPLRSGDRVIGALDLQSKVPDAFFESDIPIFQALADNIAVAIDNARLLENAEARVRENQALNEQLRQNLVDIQRLNLQLTERSWRDYLVKVERQNLSVDLNNDQIMDLTQVTPTLNEAIQTNRVVQHIIGGASLVAIPIAVRGLVIGAFEFELDGEQALDTEDLEMMQTVSERLGLALESSRLFEENRRTAQREAVVNEIGSRITASNSVNSVLNEAARSIQNTLGANRVAIRLGTPPGNGHDRDRRPS